MMTRGARLKLTSDAIVVLILFALIIYLTDPVHILANYGIEAVAYMLIGAKLASIQCLLERKRKA